MLKSRDTAGHGGFVTQQSYQGAIRCVGIGAGAFVSDRREGYDRRDLTWRTFIRGGLTPRRRGNRRGTEHQALVDWHEPHLLFLSVAILLLSVTDALLTLTLMAHGAHEANPLLAFLLESHPRWFAGVKMALTGGGVLVLVALARARLFRIIKVSAIMHWCLLAYVTLIAYEWWLLQQTL
jgi:hypothetical protein